MRKKSFILPFIIALMSTSNVLWSQTLDLTSFNLEAEYPLTSDLNDAVMNYDTVTTLSPVISTSGIYSRGCYIGQTIFADTCNIMTPQVNAMNDNAFAIQVDFKLSSFNNPIIQAGVTFRYLGLETDANGVLGLITGSGSFDNINSTVLQLNSWYNATLIHNTADSITQVYIDSQLVFTKHQYLNHPTNENQISNTNFGTSSSFHGYWKNLKIYSTNITLSIENIMPEKSIIIYPNPVSSVLNFEFDENLSSTSYKIFDISGQCIEQSTAREKYLDVSTFKAGLYFVTFYEDEGILGTGKFIKE